MVLVIGGTLAVAGATATAGHEASVAPQPKVAKHIERCPGALRAVRFYRAAFTHWQGRMGLSGAQDAILTACRHLRRAAGDWQYRASQARKTWIQEYDWRRWLPEHWVNLAQCEEGLDWRHHSGGYEGTFAFATSTWDTYRYPSYPLRAWRATPRQQWRVALRVAAKLTIAVPWGCWRGPQHAWVRAGRPEYGTRA